VVILELIHAGRPTGDGRAAIIRYKPTRAAGRSGGAAGDSW
jgi:hypothetical protein